MCRFTSWASFLFHCSLCILPSNFLSLLFSFCLRSLWDFILFLFGHVSCCVAQADFKLTVLMSLFLWFCDSRYHVFITIPLWYALMTNSIKWLLCSLCLQLLYCLFSFIFFFARSPMLAFSLSVKNFRDIFDKSYIRSIDCFNMDI